jgi:hypothetical protein
MDTAVPAESTRQWIEAMKQAGVELCLHGLPVETGIAAAVA